MHIYHGPYRIRARMDCPGILQEWAHNCIPGGWAAQHLWYSGKAGPWKQRYLWCHRRWWARVFQRCNWPVPRPGWDSSETQVIETRRTQPSQINYGGYPIMGGRSMGFDCLSTIPLWMTREATYVPHNLYHRDRWKRGTGYFLPGVWGCPPALEVPQDCGD